MHDPDCPICRLAKATAPYRTKDRRGVVIEHPDTVPDRTWPEHLEPKDKGDG